MSESRNLKSRRVGLEKVLETGCRHVFDLWETLRGGRMAPSWREFDLMALPPEVVAFTRVVDIRHDPFDIVYRFWGTGLVTMLGEERTGKSLIDYPAARVRQATAEYETVLRERRPFCFVYDTRTSRGAPPLYAPAIRLPLSDDGETVNHVIAHADFSANHEKWRRIFQEGGED